MRRHSRGVGGAALSVRDKGFKLNELPRYTEVRSVDANQVNGLEDYGSDPDLTARRRSRHLSTPEQTGEDRRDAA